MWGTVDTVKLQEATVTEEEWLGCRRPREMLCHLEAGDLATDRKLHLLAAACCRLVWPLLPEASRRAVVMAERLAEEAVDDLALFETVRAAIETACEIADPEANLAAEMAYRAANRDGWYAAAVVGYGPDADREVAALRDIFGNPFRPVTIDPARLTPTVVSLAQAIYDERAFDRMPVLGDALKDAGCDSEDILDHCRSQTEHVRGCWMVDAVLGKA